MDDGETDRPPLFLTTELAQLCHLKRPPNIMALVLLFSLYYDTTTYVSRKEN